MYIRCKRQTRSPKSTKHGTHPFQYFHAPHQDQLSLLNIHKLYNSKKESRHVTTKHNGGTCTLRGREMIDF